MILVTRRLPEDLLGRLRAIDEVELWEPDEPMPRDRLLSSLPKATGLLCMLTDRIDEEAISIGRSLRVISQMAVGLDNVDIEACRRRGIRVGHTPGVLTETVADTAFGLMAAAVRRIPQGERAVRAGQWGTWSPFADLGDDLHGRTLGIVGMGGVGQALARRSTGFDMEVIYASPRVMDGAIGRRVSLEILLEEADIVVLCAPLNSQTRGMIGADRLAAMKPSAFLVNVARGSLVDTSALVEALATGEIAGAALDVVDPEPLPPSHPLLDFENCLVTPHIGSASVRARRAMAALAVDNLVAGLGGAEMPSEHSFGD
jgi:lactate dehydrogenase-like 2-hydroxyacid dehydrogenase